MNLGCLNILTFGLLGRAASKTAPAKEPLPYGLRDEFLSAAELSFFHVLRSTLGADGEEGRLILLHDSSVSMAATEDRVIRFLQFFVSFCLSC